MTGERRQTFGRRPAGADEGAADMERMGDASVSAGSIGQRVAWWRQRRGLGRGDLADGAGISVSALTSLEAGREWMDRRGLVVTLAARLRIDPGDLAGQPYPPIDDDHVDVLDAVFRLRRFTAGQDQPVPETELFPAVAQLIGAAHAGDEHTVALISPAVLAAADHGAAIAAPGEQAQVSCLRAEAYAAAVGLVRRLGYKDLSWTLLHRLRAEEAAQPSVRLEKVRLLLDLGLARQAAARALDGPPVPDLLLTAALAWAASGDEVRAEQALVQVEVLPAEPAQQIKTRAAVEVELGHYAAAREHARSVDVDDLDATDRVELQLIAATAAARQGDIDAAVALLTDADATAPLRFRLHPFARDILAVLPACAGDVAPLRRLAERAGLSR